jgi:hypothetical protein
LSSAYSVDISMAHSNGQRPASYNPCPLRGSYPLVPWSQSRRAH